MNAGNEDRDKKEDKKRERRTGQVRKGKVNH